MNNKKFDLRVLEVKDNLPKVKLPRDYDERLPSIPGVTLFIGRPKSGKTLLCANYLFNENFAGSGKKTPGIFDQIYYVSPTCRMDRSTQLLFNESFQDKVIVYEDTDNLDAFIQNIMDYQSSFPIDDEDNPRPIIAIVMDDISGALKRNKLTTHLSSRYRHFSIGQLIYINQTLKDLPAICRTTAENVFVAKTTSILEQQKILDEWSDLYEHRLLMAWNHCVDEPHSFAYLKMDKLVPELYKVNSNGFEKVDWRSFPVTLPTDLKKMYREKDKNEKLKKNKTDDSIINKNE